MKTIFEKANGAANEYIPPCAVSYKLDQSLCRKSKADLPQIAESELCRHYSLLAKNTYGINSGFYPLGSCTMKYNPKINEKTASLKGFTDIHPLQPENSVQGAREVLDTAKDFYARFAVWTT